MPISPSTCASTCTATPGTAPWRPAPTSAGGGWRSSCCWWGNGGNYEEKPDYEANLAFAARLTERLNALAEGICRPVLVKNGRYNQHAGTPSALIEVGHNLNTLEEALAAMPYLAEALDDLLRAP